MFELFPRSPSGADNMGNQLSGGEQQMLAIGRALVTNPRLLILDEATEGLAPLVREEIWRCLAALRAAGQAILVIDKYVQRLSASPTATRSSRRAGWRGRARPPNSTPTARSGTGISACRAAATISCRHRRRRASGL